MAQNNEELHALFKSIDTDNSGSLSLPEVILQLKSITDDISEENIETIFDGIDASGDKVVDFEEFKSVLTAVSEKGWNKLTNVGDIKEVEVKALFNLIDKDRSGELSLDEARQACKLIQARFKITKVDDWMDKVDTNKDGSLSYEEFKHSLDGKMAIIN
eukprot:TRINITY_DN22709_c0_g1_i1.p1 TRINITY_DN22709_c0_g1~~TRINITY_DN22709_c0_g1_i1.p1  ORF type:complete len:185 (+),score=82.29 TRINITY_DN22709_c0_g1_i1:79-555(+)